MPTDALLLRDVPEERRFSMERYADELGKALGERPDIRARGATVHLPGAFTRLGLDAVGSYLVRFLSYPLAASRKRADVFHIVDHSYAHLAHGLPRDRTVITCHDLMLLRAEEGVAGFKGRPSSVIRFRWTIGYLKRVAHIICVSEATREDIIRLAGVPRERTSVVYSGVDSNFRRLPGDRRRRLREDLGLGEGPLILSVSSGNLYKNPAAVLHTLALVRQRGSDARLVCCGRPLVPGLLTLARELGVDDAVIQLGVVSDQRLAEAYNACDVFLFPSYYEGFGLPALEAMACGLPVVTSTAPALQEVIGEAGLTAAPDDHHGLADAVTLILDSPEVAGGLRQAGLERAASFTWSRTADQVAAIYAQVREG